MDSRRENFPFDHKPKKNLSDYILDDEEEAIEDLSFNTKDNDKINTEDIRICTDPASPFFMRPEGEGTLSGDLPSGIYDGGSSRSGRFNKSEVSSKTRIGDSLSDLEDFSLGIGNTLPKKEIEVLSLSDEEIAHKNLKNQEKHNEKRHIKPSNETTNKYVVALVIIGSLLMIGYSTFIQSIALNNRQKQLSDNSMKQNENNNSNNNSNNSNKSDNKQEAKGINILNYNKQTKENTGSWDIRFTDMYEKSKIGTAKEISAPTYNSTKASFHVSLASPGDEITYDLTIKNFGTLNAKISSIYVIPENKDDDVIFYYVDGIEIGDVLDAGQSTNMTVTAKFNENVSSIPNIVKTVAVIINYVQR